MSITVINIKGRILPPGVVYVGRAMRGRRGSALANPFRMRSEADRPKVIAQYTEWLDKELATLGSPAYHEFWRLYWRAKGDGLTMACWCHPAACHADVIKARIEAALAEETAQ